VHALQYVPGGGGGGGLQYVSGGGVSASCLDNSLAQDLVWVATDDRRYNHKKQENQNRFFLNLRVVVILISNYPKLFEITNIFFVKNRLQDIICLYFNLFNEIGMSK